MNRYTWAWVGWIAAFAAIEAAALFEDNPDGERRTLSAHVWHLVRGDDPRHRSARVALILALAWQARHLLQDEPSVPSVPGGQRH